MKIFLAALCLTGFALAAKTPPPPPSTEAGTVPPPQYVTDVYAPPPDWIPAREIRDYSLNTRVPDLFWLKYDGAYAPALRIRPISGEQISKNLEVKLIDGKRANSAKLFFADSEKDASNRRIVIRDLNVPADDVIALSFKLRRQNAPSGPVFVRAEGLNGAVVSTDKNADGETPCFDGFSAYKAVFPAQKGAILRGFTIEVPPGEKYNPDEEYVLFDLILKRNAPKARFTDLPQRQWVRKSAFGEKRPLTVKDGIADVREFMNSNPPNVESIALPVRGWELRPQTDKEKDGGFTVENVKVNIAGKDVEALRITLEKGSRCYLKFPVKFDAVKFNTMTMLAKIELPGDLPPFRKFGDTYSQIFGNNAADLNRFFDVFSFGVFSASGDPVDWNQWGVSQGHSKLNRQTKANAPEGWSVLAQDLRHGDMPGNKTTTLTDITHWCFYYANAKIPEGKKVIVTIADPKVSSGLMLAGGDMEKYKEFLAEEEKRLLTDFSDSSKYLDAPTTNRLAKPLPFVRDHNPLGEIVLAGSWENWGPSGVYKTIPMRAVNYFQDLLKNKYGLTRPIPVLDQPSSEDNVKIFIGGNRYASVNKEQFEADKKALKDSTGFAVRANGKQIYIYGGDFNYAGSARGMANGLWTFIENNTDDIMSMTSREKSQSVFEFEKSGDMDLVWGDEFVNIPAIPLAVVFSSRPEYLDRNCAWQEDSWNLKETRGGVRGYSTGHWLAHYGTRFAEGENETWGIDEQGKRIKPDCYSRHCCMINVLEPAKAEYVTLSQTKVPDSIYNPDETSFRYNTFDAFGFWLEDNNRWCLCEKCRTPIRLPGGELLPPDDPDFRGTQYFFNGTAMIQSLNVHSARKMKIEAIGYFWMSNPPRIEISRNFIIRFCPYFRKNYFEPIYAPCNDIFWRAMNRWSQTDVTLYLYDYFLNVFFRPWGTIASYDVKAERDIGVQLISHEGAATPVDMMERWITLQMFRNPDADVQQLRKYFIRRTFREAAPDMEKFYFTLNNFIYKDFAKKHLMEIEDFAWIGVHGFLTKSETHPELSVMEEADMYFENAQKKVRNPRARAVLEELAKYWKAYFKEAETFSKTLPPPQKK